MSAVGMLCIVVVVHFDFFRTTRTVHIFFLVAAFLLVAPDPQPQLFRRLARPPGAKEGGGHSAARDNALVFLRGHLGPAPSSWDRDRRKAFRKRVKGACRLIEAIVTADELG